MPACADGQGEGRVREPSFFFQTVIAGLDPAIHLND